jgi:ribokinase
VPAEARLTADDVERAAEQIAACQVLSIQLEQPGEAVRAALTAAPARAMVVVDGAPADEVTRTAVLARADVVRADAAEAASLVGRDLSGPEAARDAAAELLTAGPRLVVLATGAAGDLVAWRAGPDLRWAATELDADPRWADGDLLVPRLGDPPVDPNGAGDAFVAALVATLLGGAGPEDAAWAAAAAAALTAGHAGSRPALDPATLGAAIRRYRPA